MRLQEEKIYKRNKMVTPYGRGRKNVDISYLLIDIAMLRTYV